jgi:Na+/H+ antiporter NhaD/arsenite permease-like protein
MADVNLGPLVTSLVVFVLTYAGILIGRIHRTIVALAGAVFMLALGIWFSFYDVPHAVAAIDFNTISLLFGMMLVVGIFKGTGFFQYLAIKAGKLARGEPWLLLVYLGLATSLVSTVLDNVTTIIIVVPVTVSMADILGIPALPFLVSEALLSNIGGVATLIGDPPNVLIGSAAGFSFTDFLTHLAPIVLLTWILAQGLLLLLFRRSLMRQPVNGDRLMAMDEKRAIMDPLTTRRMLETLGFTIVLFLIHDRVGFDPGLVALTGACIGLLWVRPKLEELLKDIHWDVLLFFIALFVVIGGLDAAGVFQLVGSGVEYLAAHGMVFAVLAVLWVGALASGIVGNIPFTIAMLPVLKGIEISGVSVAPLWWALALGVGFGGNLTPIGAAANVLVVSVAQQTGEPLTFRTWLKSGTVVSIATCGFGSLALFVALELGLL